MADLDFTIVELTADEAAFSYPADLIEETNPSSFQGDIIGQPRALKALEMGIEIQGKGYNIFVTGEPGTGRMTAIRNLLKDRPADTSQLHDFLYIHNFVRPDVPVAVTLPAGRGQEFAAAMKAVTRCIKESIMEQVSGQESRIDTEALIELVRPVIDETLAQFQEPKIDFYLRRIEEDLREFSFIFTGADADTVRNAQFFQRYSVNLQVDNSHTKTLPVIYESHPTFTTLFGAVEAKGDSRDDNFLPFLSIHGGSILDAAGGYLVVNADDLLKEDGLWEQLKRVLKTSTVTLQHSQNSLSSGSTGIRPEPFPVQIKVIALGSEELYDALYNEDPDFSKLFKISAEFDFSMQSNSENIGNYIGFIKMIEEDEHLIPVETSGIAALLRYGSYLVEQRGELSTQFSLIADLLRESQYWAGKMGKTVIDHDVVNRAIDERNYLLSLPESKIIDQILSGEMLIDLEGSKVGKVNALAVLDRGFYSFGIPTVISATVAPGNEGIVNIEHEAGLSGEIHDKGLLILEGYLRKMYARNFPLSMYSGICFEQSYAEVDGDSASSSELYALLSAIGNIPIRQDIAVTGSVNQMGEIQPVGGINEKITGFFTICERRGLTGRQGVIIPRLNIKNLILPERILDAIHAKRFHIYPIDRIDQGMQILSSRPAGARNSKGSFPVNTINRLVEDRLKRLYEISRQPN